MSVWTCRGKCHIPGPPKELRLVVWRGSGVHWVAFTLRINTTDIFRGACHITAFRTLTSSPVIWKIGIQTLLHFSYSLGMMNTTTTAAGEMELQRI